MLVKLKDVAPTDGEWTEEVSLFMVAINRFILAANRFEMISK